MWGHFLEGGDGFALYITLIQSRLTPFNVLRIIPFNVLHPVLYVAF